MIRLGTKKIIPFYEDYKPVEVRRNNVRIAGWLTETKSGEAVDFENTYNDKAKVLVHGNSMQNGEPSPENPVPVLSAGECNLLISDRTGVRQSIALPPLRKIGDVADTYNPETGELVQRIGRKVFDGTEAWALHSINEYGVSNFRHSFQNVTTAGGLCTHYKRQTTNIADTVDEGFTLSYNSYIYLRSLVFSTVDDFKTYLAAQHAASTPVTVYYQLVEPIITHLDPVTVPTYPGYTKLEQDGAVKGTIEARCKVMEW